MTKVALITGITGQDGSYLAEYLLSKNYVVHGLIRRASTFNTSRLEPIYVDPHNSERFFLHYADLSDASRLSGIINEIQPDEIYNLAAQSHVRVSFDMPEYTSDIDGLGVSRILEAIRRLRDKKIKLYQASTSELFGSSKPPQNEDTSFKPRSPYACAKLYAYWMVRNYREGYDIFGSNGILFNHESPRRGETFVTRKITSALAKLYNKKQKHLYLGNLDAKRDWGFAPEYVENMWKMLQQNKPDDFVIGTGEAHSVKEYLDLAFDYVGLNPKKYVEIDKRYFRPTEVECLIADSSKAEKDLGWKPKIAFEDQVKILVDADFRKNGLEPIGEGDTIIKKKFSKKWWKGD